MKWEYTAHGENMRTDPTRDVQHVGSTGTAGPAATPGEDPADADSASYISALTFLAGVWLLLAPFALNYADDAGFDAARNDLVIGVAIALVAIVRIVAPIRSAALGMVNVALGAWLIIAPFVLAYNEGANALAATWNDIVVGVIVLALAATSALFGACGYPWVSGSRSGAGRP